MRDYLLMDCQVIVMLLVPALSIYEAEEQLFFTWIIVLMVISLQATMMVPVAV
jgi:hypothetical protein